MQTKNCYMKLQVLMVFDAVKSNIYLFTNLLKCGAMLIKH